VWLTPTLGLPPPALGFFDAGKLGGAIVLDRFIEFLPFTPFANMTGQPAISLPLFWNQDGLPIGAQFFGRYGDETTLFQLATQLERARPWATRRPPICAP
jgi:amidase